MYPVAITYFADTTEVARCRDYRTGGCASDRFRDKSCDISRSEFNDFCFKLDGDSLAILILCFALESLSIFEAGCYVVSWYEERSKGLAAPFVAADG